MGDIKLILGVVVVLGLIGFALIRWAVHKRRVDVAMRAALQDQDPRVRMAALRLLGRMGAIGRYTGVLLWRVRVESDPDVHGELAVLASSDGWAGSSSTERTEFHLWGVAEMLRRTHPAHIELESAGLGPQPDIPPATQF